jgi:molybdenum cofactor biosynthesis enzyme MoaA
MQDYDFANILFAGPCNRSCPFCIGKDLPESANANNLGVFPPRNWDEFVKLVKECGIKELVFTGTTTDPHLYLYEEELLALTRSELPSVQISIHTNAVLSLKKLSTFNSYDRACISLPTLNPVLYQKMMGSTRVPNLEEILRKATIPVKISCIINEHSVDELDTYLNQLSALGVRRVVLRRLHGDTRNWNILTNYVPTTYYRNNPVYTVAGMEVTWWNFNETTSRSINLFADGRIGSEYLLTNAYTANQSIQPLVVKSKTVKKI